YAGRFGRFIAYLLDSVIVTGLFYLTIIILEYFFDIPVENSYFYILMVNLVNPFEATRDQGMLYLLYNYGITGAIWLVYEVVFVLSSLGATPGKRALRMEVVCYKNPGFIKVFIRSIIKIFMIFTVAGVLIEFLVMAFSRKKQTLHDLITATYVIKKKELIQRVLSDEEMLFEEMKKGNIRTYSEQIGYLKSLKRETTYSKKDGSTGVWWMLIFVMLLVPPSYAAKNYDVILDNISNFSEFQDINIYEYLY
ncbi:MAG: RDD family protein, partial [Clostridiaceae bacterium]|nr:RDD family protein [Clostridiaceae bacterium]